jgi:glycosyltransferase involved in cell wall biosynthesis
MLAPCLLALKKQLYENYEILVVDNAPDNDDTKQLAQRLRVRYVRESKPGLDRARNMGIREARNGIIAFTDDDAKTDPLWLQSIARGFRDPGVTALTGYVAPTEMETRAQQMFEWAYGGMGHGFVRKVYDGSTMGEREKLAVSGFGVGANMAYRKEWFSRGGYFDHALDVGTPSSGGGDIEMFHRVVAFGEKLVYEPDMLVWHTHRRTMEHLHKQVFNNGRSFVCYLMTCFRNGTADTGNVLGFFFKNWLYHWHLKNLFFGNGLVSRRLLITELKGMMTGPSAYFESRRSAKQLDADPL